MRLTYFNIIFITTAAEGDYKALSQSLGPFSSEERRLCVSLVVSDDGQCDESPSERLTVNLNSSDPNVTLTPATAAVIILDSPQCSECVIIVQHSAHLQQCHYNICQETCLYILTGGNRIVYRVHEWLLFYL